MADSTNPFLTVARSWDHLEPAMAPDTAKTKNVKLAASKTYAMGQIVGPVTATPGLYDKPGTGVTGPYLPLEYPVVTDANNLATLGDTSFPNATKFESVPVYYQGYFFVKDLVGVADDTIMGGVGNLRQGTGRADTAAIIKLG